MNIEETSALERRVRRHAALADAARLRMVDLLTIGDRSPTELREHLALPSNLVAHHLNVLERAGIITRVRSEGDGRRSYVRLDAGALPDLDPQRAISVPRIVFVCTANSARSQLARAIWGTVSAVPAASGGTHPADGVAAGATAVAARHGLDLRDATPRLVDDLVADDDLIVTVCDRAHEECAARAVGALHWSVPDPVRIGTDAAFEAAFTEIEHRVAALAPRVRAA